MGFGLKNNKGKITMKKQYTHHEIENALNEMQGFVDVTTEDIQELLSHLNKTKKHRQKPIRNAKYIALKLMRSLRTPPTHVKRVKLTELLYSGTFSFIGIALLGIVHMVDPLHIFTIGSFGASAVLLYGAPRSPLSQPLNLIGGHVISALIGVTIYHLVPDPIWLSAALSVSLAITAMHLTKTLHPPGGATALIAIIGGNKIHTLGFSYVITPVLTGAMLMFIVAWIANNSVKGRRYPLYWW